MAGSTDGRARFPQVSIVCLAAFASVDNQPSKMHTIGAGHICQTARYLAYGNRKHMEAIGWTLTRIRRFCG